MQDDLELITPQALDAAFSLPARAYRDAEISELEQCRVLARGWQLAGHVSQLQETGQTLRLEMAGIPLVILRDGEQLRALHAVCRHRAGPLQVCPGRGGQVLRCRYHGWTYDSAGQLIAAGEMHTASDFDISSIQLPAAQVEVRHGLVFVALAPQCNIDELLEGCTQKLQGLGLENWRHAGSQHYTVACNWKGYVDNYLEGYHVPHIHPALNRVLDYRNYKVELGRWNSLQHSPLQGAEGVYADGEALYWFIYPNAMLNLLPERLQTNRVLPLGPDRCRVEFDYYYPAEQASAERMARDHQFADEVQAEDVEICEAVQIGMASGSWQRGRINPLREDAVHHFHELWRSDFRNAPQADR